MAPVFIVFFGPPGCGKGTQAKKITEELGLTQISTGDLFRKHLGEKTELGQKAKAFMDKGELVPDDITIGMVRERLQEPDIQQGAMFDGFPRTGAQAVALDELLAEFDSNVTMVVDFVLPIEVSRERLLARQEGRADDNPDVINKRLNDHQAVEDSVMPHYRAKDGLVKAIDAQRTIDAIYVDVRTLIQSVLQ